MSTLLSSLRATLATLAIFTFLCCGLYPLAVTGLATQLFPGQAAGSLLKDKTGAVVGSSLIGQNFTRADYFWGRLSATADAPYNAKASSGSNLGVNNPALTDAVKARLSALGYDPAKDHPVPVDLVTASASGLDPDISPAAALYQVPRIAKARGVPEDQVRAAIEFATTERSFGLFGEPRVSVLKANLKLDDRIN